MKLNICYALSNSRAKLLICAVFLTQLQQVNGNNFKYKFMCLCHLLKIIGKAHEAQIHHYFRGEITQDNQTVSESSLNYDKNLEYNQIECF